MKGAGSGGPPLQSLNSKEVIDIGEKTKENTTIAQDMRTATEDDGSLLFSEKDWLQPNQVKNLFRSMAKESTDGDEPEDNPDKMLQNILENTIAMRYPVIFCEKRNRKIW